MFLIPIAFTIGFRKSAGLDESRFAKGAPKIFYVFAKGKNISKHEKEKSYNRWIYYQSSGYLMEIRWSVPIMQN
jgi:hypothetical protein